MQPPWVKLPDLVRVATIREMKSLIKDVEEISARKLGILRGHGSVENGSAPFPARREAVRMFLRGSIPCVFFLAINVDRPEQYAELLRNLQAVYRRFCQERGLARAFCANSALYA